MNPVALLAELIAHGLDVANTGGVIQYVGDPQLVPASLLLDLDTNHRELETFLTTWTEEPRHVH